jgi:hypothetical protein
MERQTKKKDVLAMLKDKFLVGFKGMKYVLYSGLYTMEFTRLEDATDYKNAYKITGTIVKEG